LLPAGSERDRFLYGGTADEHGEYPVFAFETDEPGSLVLTHPGFDVFVSDGLASHLGGAGYADDWGELEGALGDALRAQARSNFGGFTRIDILGRYNEHVDGDAALRTAFDNVFGPFPDGSPLDDPPIDDFD